MQFVFIRNVRLHTAIGILLENRNLSFFLLYLLCISIPYRRSYHVYIVASFQHSVFLIPLSVVFRSFNRNLLAPIPYSRFQIR